MSNLPCESLPMIMDSVLAEAGVSKAVRARAVGIANEIQYITGEVILVHTRSQNRIIYVSAQRALQLGFLFPPNPPAFEAELIRAQGAGLTVSVAYRPDAQSPSMSHIDSVQVHAGISVSAGPRY